MEQKEAEEKAVESTRSFSQKKDLTDEEREKLSDVVVEFCQHMCGTTLYPYEHEFCWRVVYSLICEDADELTALFGRQMGKTETIAVTVCGCCVILPLLSESLPNDRVLSKFKDGLWCGIYAPNYEQAGTMWSRMKLRLYSSSSKKVLLDPEIDIDLTNKAENMRLPNGSYVNCGTASPQSKIEGKTYHLILIEECQDISSTMIRSSIHPMASATAGTIVKIGTPSRTRSEFFDACRRNKRHDVSKGMIRSRKRLHFEFDYTIGQRYNQKYKKYVEKERVRLGEDSDDFKQKYRLHWLLERGMFIDQDLLEECGIKSSKDPLILEIGKGKRKTKKRFSRPPMVVTNDSKNDHVASIDIGRQNSTVVTVGRPFWDGPVQYGNETRYPIHISNWLEIHGDDHEAQHPQILSFLKNYRLSSVIIDATGKGDPVYSRLAAELDKFGITVLAFTFTEFSKDIGYKVFLQELQCKRFTYPAGSGAVRQRKWQNFFSQMCDLEKTWRGQKMVVRKSTSSDAKDDFCDSSMLLCYLVNVSSNMEVEQEPNPFVGRAAKWFAAEMMRESGAWYRGNMNPRGVIPKGRPNKRGKW